MEGERDPGAPVGLEFGAAPVLLSQKEKSDEFEKKNKNKVPLKCIAIGIPEKSPDRRSRLAGGGKSKKLHSRFCGFARLARLCIIGDDGLKVSALSPLLAAVAIGSGRSDTGHLFTLVQHGLCEINALHVVELEGVGGGATAERERGGAPGCEVVGCGRENEGGAERRGEKRGTTTGKE